MGCFAWLFVIYKRRKQKKLNYQLDHIEKNASYEFRQIKEESEEVLKSSLDKFKDAGVSSIYLLHGTFVGPDPFDIYSFLEKTYPKIQNQAYQVVKDQLTKGQNLISKDNGNFTDEHISLINQYSDLKCFNFSWSSGNHHYARLKGALKLLEHLCKHHEADEKIRLIGHSHAGALFALLTQLQENKEFAKLTEKIIETQGLHVDNFKILLKKSKKMKLQFVTLGSPKRYKWPKQKNNTLLHIINHRGDLPLGGKIRGFLTTKDGDYIQQWGQEGSDIISPILEENLINEELNNFLGEGQNFELLKEKVYQRSRLHNLGHHLLIDYRDNSSIPNFIPSVFGHGVYTKVKYFSYHLNVITEFFD